MNNNQTQSTFVIIFKVILYVMLIFLAITVFIIVPIIYFSIIYINSSSVNARVAIISSILFLFIGSSFFIAKRKFLMVYSILEIVIGIISSSVGAIRFLDYSEIKSKEYVASSLIIIMGGLYIIVRGLESLEKDLVRRHRRRQFSWLLGKGPWPKP